MNNNKINLLPNSKPIDDNYKTKDKQIQPDTKKFLMHIPCEKNDGENNPDENQQNERENPKKLDNNDIKSRNGKPPQIAFFKKLKNIFSKNKK